MEKKENRERYLPYRCVLEGGTGEIVEKKSRFLATVRKVETEEEAAASEASCVREGLVPAGAVPVPETLLPQEELEQREGALSLYQKLHALPEPYREVFWLRVYGELTFAEIAALHHKTESWARVTFYRARMKMKEAIL